MFQRAVRQIELIMVLIAFLNVPERVWIPNVTSFVQIRYLCYNLVLPSDGSLTADVVSDQELQMW